MTEPHDTVRRGRHLWRCGVLCAAAMFILSGCTSAEESPGHAVASAYFEAIADGDAVRAATLLDNTIPLQTDFLQAALDGATETITHVTTSTIGRRTTAHFTLGGARLTATVQTDQTDDGWKVTKSALERVSLPRGDGWDITVGQASVSRAPRNSDEHLGVELYPAVYPLDANSTDLFSVADEVVVSYRTTTDDIFQATPALHLAQEEAYAVLLPLCVPPPTSTDVDCSQLLYPPNKYPHVTSTSETMRILSLPVPPETGSFTLTLEENQTVLSYRSHYRGDFTIERTIEYADAGGPGQPPTARQTVVRTTNLGLAMSFFGTGKTNRISFYSMP